MRQVHRFDPAADPLPRPGRSRVPRPSTEDCLPAGPRAIAVEHPVDR
jgi:hypothetical protein